MERGIEKFAFVLECPIKIKRNYVSHSKYVHEVSQINRIILTFIDPI